MIDAESGWIKALLLSAFESSKQYFFDQLLLSMKTAPLTLRIEQDLADERSAVVQLVSTMEANLHNKLTALSDRELIDCDDTPHDMICPHSKTDFPVHQRITTVDAHGRKRSGRVLGPEGNATVNRQAEQSRDHLMDEVAVNQDELGIAIGTIQMPRHVWHCRWR